MTAPEVERAFYLWVIRKIMALRTVSVEELLNMEFKMTWKKISDELPKEFDSIILLTHSTEFSIIDVYGTVRKNEKGSLELRVVEFDDEGVPNNVNWEFSANDRWFKIPFTREELVEQVKIISSQS
jgi:hypothetical protein